MEWEKDEDRAEGRPIYGWLIHSRGFIMRWMADHSFMVWKLTGKGGSIKLWGIVGQPMAPRMRMKIHRGS